MLLLKWLFDWENINIKAKFFFYPTSFVYAVVANMRIFRIFDEWAL